ncbi:hypothetical protein THAOC_27355, partial [Thalassiosira oceanica]
HCETGLLLFLANGGTIAVTASVARATAENEGDRDFARLITQSSPLTFFAYLDDDAAHLVPRHKWKSMILYIAIMSRPAVPVTPAYSGRHDYGSVTIHQFLLPFPWPESRLVLELVTAPPLLMHSEAPMRFALTLLPYCRLLTQSTATVEHQLGLTSR